MTRPAVIPDPPHIVELIDLPDGSTVLSIEVSEAFKEWFTQNQGLNEWSTPHFEDWIEHALDFYIATTKAGAEHER